MEPFGYLKNYNIQHEVYKEGQNKVSYNYNLGYNNNNNLGNNYYNNNLDINNNNNINKIVKKANIIEEACIDKFKKSDKDIGFDLSLLKRDK